MSVLKFEGVLVGVAIGDSLGALYESSKNLKNLENLENLRYTDDTITTISVVEALIENRGFNPEKISEKLVENYFKEPWRGYGKGPSKIFTMLKQGRKWYEMLDRLIYEDGSIGNGAAMRASPLGLIYSDPCKLKKIVYEASIITHSNSLAIEGAFIQAYSISLIVNNFINDKLELLEKVEKFVDNKEYVEKFKIIKDFLRYGASKKEVIKKLGNEVKAINSVPTALFSFLITNSFEEAIKYAIDLGGDSDTIGSMTGALAGAYYGINTIPSYWIEKLENLNYILELARRLWKLKNYY